MGFETLLQRSDTGVSASNTAELYEAASARIEEAQAWMEANYYLLWRVTYSYYKGQQYGEDFNSETRKRDFSRRKKERLMTYNEVRNAVNLAASIMTDNRPKWTVLGRTPDDMTTADLHGLVLDSRWQWLNLVAKTWKSVIWAHLSGTVHWKVTWNPYAVTPTGSKGDVAVQVIDPMMILVDPSASDEVPPRWIAHKIKTNIFDAKRQYDIKANQYRDGAKTVEPGTDYTQVPSFRSLIGDAIDQEDPTALDIWEIWYQDLDHKNEASFLAIANGKVIGGGPSPFWTHGFPFETHSLMPEPGSYFGTGIEDVLDMQDEINARNNQIIRNEMRFGDPVWLVPLGAKIERDSLLPGGKVLRYDPQYPPPSVVTPGQLAGELFQSVSYSQERFDKYMSIVPVVRGLPPKNVPSASGLAQLFEAAQAPYRSRVRFLEESLGRVGYQVLCRLAQYGNASQLERVYVDEEELALFSEMMEGGVEPGRGGMAKPAFIRFGDLFSKETLGYDVSVQAGSTLPSSRGERFQQALALFQAGTVDAQAVLEAAGFPGWQKVVARMKGRELEMQAQQQAMAEQAAKETQGVPSPFAGIAPPIPTMVE